MTMSTILPTVVGQTFAKLYFERVLTTERLSHAYLFWGDRGSGKHQFAREFAKAIQCKQGMPCGECSVCRSVDHGNHPGVHEFGPQEGKSFIDIATVRALCERVQYKSDHTQVVILKNADSLGEPAANALLKTLEEPPAGAVLILIARSTGSLLSTLVSRCHRIPFRAEPNSENAVAEVGFLKDLVAPEFFAQHDPRAWLSDTFPEAGTQREAVRQALETLVEHGHQRLHASTDATLDGSALDGDLDRLAMLLELLEALEGNVHADLVFEELLRDLRL